MRRTRNALGVPAVKHWAVRAVLLIVVGFSAPVFGQAVRYVDTSATGPGHDGTGWCAAFLNLDSALAVASTGDVIRIADGSYAPDPAGLADPRAATFTLVSGVTIEGGYAGCGASNPDQRDPGALVTVLTGDVGGNDPADESFFRTCCNTTFQPGCADQTCSDAVCAVQPLCCGGGWQSECVTLARSLCGSLCVSKDDNSYSVLTATNVTVTLDGVTIQRGEADGDALLFNETTRGAAVFALGGSLTLANCVIRDNHAKTVGGGIRVDGGALSLLETVFENNLASAYSTEGGGEGGAVDAVNGVLTVSKCRFMGNGASDGGAVFLSDSTGSIDASLFSGNWDAAILLQRSSPPVRDCDFLANLGGLRLDRSGSIISSCRIIGNYGPGLKCSGETTPSLVNCIVANNISGSVGGGIDAGGDVIVASTVVVRNYAFAGGGGIYTSTTTHVLVQNSIVWGNTAETGGGNIMLRTLAGFVPTLTVEFSIVEGGTSGIVSDGTVVWLGGNIDADPSFMDPDGRDNVQGTIDDDYRLAPSSPAIDTGDNALVLASVTTDLVGNSRISDGDGDGVAIVDIGPLEVVVPIPAVSVRGLLMFSLSLVVTGSVLVRRRRSFISSREMYHDSDANDTRKGGGRILHPCFPWHTRKNSNRSGGQ